MMSDKQVNGMFDVSQELNAGYTFTKTQIAELESLRKENAALLVAMVGKDATLEKIDCVGNGNSHGNSIGNCMAIEALAILPSPELLEARDRKRDAKLLRLFAKDFSSNIQEHANMSAIFRESGEWTPELGD